MKTLIKFALSIAFIYVSILIGITAITVFGLAGLGGNGVLLFAAPIAGIILIVVFGLVFKLVLTKILKINITWKYLIVVFVTIFLLLFIFLASFLYKSSQRSKQAIQDIQAEYAESGKIVKEAFVLDAVSIKGDDSNYRVQADIDFHLNPLSQPLDLGVANITRFVYGGWTPNIEDEFDLKIANCITGFFGVKKQDVYKNGKQINFPSEEKITEGNYKVVEIYELGDNAGRCDKKQIFNALNSRDYYAIINGEVIKKLQVVY